MTTCAVCNRPVLTAAELVIAIREAAAAVREAHAFLDRPQRQREPGRALGALDAARRPLERCEVGCACGHRTDSAAGPARDMTSAPPSAGSTVRTAPGDSGRSYATGKPSADGAASAGGAPFERIGNWMQTIGGRAFYPLDPRPEDIDIEDIAHALSHLCRFGGHCTKFYSVAQHCVLVSFAIGASGGTVEECMHGLLHDAAEAYVGDMVWPLKQSSDASGYKRVERLVERSIAEKFCLPLEQPPIVKRFDLVLLSTEKRDLMTDGRGREDGSKREAEAARKKLGEWHCDEFKPLPEIIVPWSPEGARHNFLVRYHSLLQRLNASPGARASEVQP